MSAACIPRKRLSAYLDNALSEAQTRRVQDHLSDCPECRQRLAALQQADDLIRALPGMTPSDGFDAAFWRKVAHHEEQQVRPPWYLALLGHWRPVLASAAVAVLVAGIFVYHKTDGRPSVAERFMVENLEMLDNLELLQQMEMLEHWDDIQAMKEQS